MGKKTKSKPKQRRARSRRCQGQIISQVGEGQIISQVGEGQINSQVGEGQIIPQIGEGQIQNIPQIGEGEIQTISQEIIIHDCEHNNIPHEIINQDCQDEVINKDCQDKIINQGFDCINEDAILCLIISSLPIKEAVRTCVLSRRWKSIWTYLPKLHFNPETVLDDETLEWHTRFLTGKDKCYLLMGKTDDFIRSVDLVLQQHQSHVTVDEFYVRYFLHKVHSHHLDAWLRFAVASKVKLFCLQLDQPHSHFNVELYDFPFHLLASSSIEELYLASCSLKPPYELDGLNRLKRLLMWCPGATGDDINHLVSHCSTLRRLDLVASKELVILSIPHSLCQLNHLTVEKCYQLKKIEINAVNLNYLFYEGVLVDFVLRQPSCLKKAKIYFRTEGNNPNLNFYLTKLASDMPHLEFLALNISGVSKVENLPKCPPSFIHLKRLEWDCPRWSVGFKMSLLYLDTLLNAAPFLEELKLHLSTCGVQEPRPRLTKLKNKLQPKHHLSRLRTFEITGFYFEKWQVQIVLYLLINAIKLDSMTLEKGCKPVKDTEKGRKPVKDISEADMKSLAQHVPANVKLVIL